MEANGGREVKTLGDGGMYVFDTAGSALGAITAIRAEDDLPIRIGAHTGDVVQLLDCFEALLSVAGIDPVEFHQRLTVAARPRCSSVFAAGRGVSLDQSSSASTVSGSWAEGCGTILVRSVSLPVAAGGPGPLQMPSTPIQACESSPWRTPLPIGLRRSRNC